MSRRHIALAFAGAALAATAARADGPLAIYSPQLLLLGQDVALEVAPEVQVKLSIDDRGKVTTVEVLGVSPSTEYDAIVRERVIETLGQWRFAPATQDGKTVASTLEWKVRFPATTEASSTTATTPATTPLRGSDAETFRAAILALPLRQRVSLLERQTRIAIAQLDAARMREVQSPRFVVRSDAADGRAAEAIAANLEAIFNVLAVELLPGVSLQPETYKLQVVVYRTRAQYHSFLTQLQPTENSVGFYSACGLIALHLEQPTGEVVTSTLLHEATHAFLDRHIVRPGVALPRWLGEGFAEYVGNSAIQRGRLKPGKTVAHQYAFVGGRLASLETSPGARLDEAKDALRRGQGLGIVEMLEASPDIFYGEKSSLFYASSWLLVHYLRDGSASWAAERFPRFLLYLAEGYPQQVAFESLYGDIDGAQKSFQQYVKSF